MRYNVQQLDDEFEAILGWNAKCVATTIGKHVENENNATLTEALAPFRAEIAEVIPKLEACINNG